MAEFEPIEATAARAFETLDVGAISAHMHEKRWRWYDGYPTRKRMLAAVQELARGIVDSGRMLPAWSESGGFRVVVTENHLVIRFGKNHPRSFARYGGALRESRSVA